MLNRRVAGVVTRLLNTLPASLESLRKAGTDSGSRSPI